MSLIRLSLISNKQAPRGSRVTKGVQIKGEKRSCTYHFAAYADLKNGDIYVIYGDADDNPQTMEPQSYYDFMDIKEECYP